MSLDRTVLTHYGGIENNYLSKVINPFINNNDNNENYQTLKTSKYYDKATFLEFQKYHKNNFTILSSNIGSIHSKFDLVQTYVDFYRSNDFEFNALCFQECWLSETDQTNHIQLDGYDCIYQSKSFSSKGGLVLYLLKRLNYKIRKTINTSSIWGGVFIDIKNGGLKKKHLH